MSDFKVSGILSYIGDTEYINETFTKRMVTLDVEVKKKDNTSFTNQIAFQLANATAPMVDNFKVGDVVEISFSLKSNRSEKDGVVRFFTNANAYSIKQGWTAKPPQQQAIEPPKDEPLFPDEPENDDLPF